MQRRKLEELSLMDDFLFNAMLTHPETGEKFTNKILKLLFNREFKNLDSVKVFSQKQIWPFGSRQSTGYDIRQQIILCF